MKTSFKTLGPDNNDEHINPIYLDRQASENSGYPDQTILMGESSKFPKS